MLMFCQPGSQLVQLSCWCLCTAACSCARPDARIACVQAAAVHGDLSQDMRTKAVQGFKEGSVPLLVATDVAARGLDIPDVELVVNYSFPLTVEDYVHRVGRSGRAGQSGELLRCCGTALTSALGPD